MYSAKDKRLGLTLSETEHNSVNFSTRLSGFKTTRQRTRTSIVPQYSIDINSSENTYETQVNEDDQSEVISGYLIKPVWNICRVSPLHKFHYSAAKLKQYATKVKQFICSAGEYDTNLYYNVTFEIVDNLKLETKHSDGLEITVTCSVGNSDDDDDNSKPIYTGILFSWGYHAAESESNLTHLPLLFDRGQEKIIKSVRHVLIQLFDCAITPYSFHQNELLLFTALLSSFVSSNGSKPVILVYNVPQTRSPTQFEITVSAEDIYTMWLSCFSGESTPSIHNEQSSQLLYSVFQNHIRYVYEVDVSQLELVSLKYPSINIQSKGRIQLKDTEVTKCVLRILCEMSVILKGTKPKLAAEYD